MTFLERSQPPEPTLLDPPHPSMPAPKVEEVPRKFAPAIDLMLPQFKGMLNETLEAITKLEIANDERDDYECLHQASKIEVAARGDWHTRAVNIVLAVEAARNEQKRKRKQKG